LFVEDRIHDLGFDLIHFVGLDDVYQVGSNRPDGGVFAQVFKQVKVFIEVDKADMAVFDA
jgi:hypothetical protein